jgi:hypothetical protein
MTASFAANNLFPMLFSTVPILFGLAGFAGEFERVGL